MLPDLLDNQSCASATSLDFIGGGRGMRLGIAAYRKVVGVPAQLLGAVLAVCLFAASAFAAAGTTVIEGFGTGFNLIPSSGGTTLYGPTGTKATWALSQWNNQSDYGNFAPFRCPRAWSSCYAARSADEWAQVYTTGGVAHLMLGERGKNVPCRTELDNFSTAISRKYPHYPQAVHAYPNLAALSKLYVNFNMVPVYDGYGRGAATCANNLTKGSIIFAISLSSNSGQTLFYQMILRSFNQPLLASAFYANSNPFGWNDTMDNYGYDKRGLPYSVATRFSKDILPRLTTIISKASNGLDTKLADWSTASIYIGNLAYGNVSVVSDWSDVSVTSVP